MYDVIIIGGGPAGVTASLYTKRANLKTLILHQDNSNLEKTNLIENYYGFEKGISGKELYETGIKQAQNIGVDCKKEEVISISQIEKGIKVITVEEEYLGKTLVLATGNKKNKPEIQGIEKFEGKGISYCAVCDGFFYKNKKVAIIGNGNYALSEYLELKDIASEITILTNGKKMEEVKPIENIAVNTEPIEEILGEEKVEAIKFQDGKSLPIDGVFIAEGVAGSLEFARKLGVILRRKQNYNK